MGQRKDSIYGNNKRNLRCNFTERQADLGCFWIGETGALDDGMITSGLSLIFTVNS